MSINYGEYRHAGCNFIFVNEDFEAIITAGCISDLIGTYMALGGAS